ncbi:MAG TPA: ATP-binding protein [Phycisphaerae bacterium]|nr:ATP-binding protein [Phycisphaerae bacterium]
MRTSTTKRLGLASVALVSLGASAAYYATMTAMRRHDSSMRGLNYLFLAMVAALTTLLLTVLWRKVNSAVRAVSEQLDQMAREHQIGLVMAEGGRELDQITEPLNRLLTVVREEIDHLRGENRELQIQSHIADAEKKHTEAIIFSISDAVIVTNRFDELILANDTAEKLLGFKLAPSLRKNIDRIIHDGTLVRLIRETRSGGRSFTRKVVEHSIDQKGRPCTFNVTLSCVMAPQGEVSGVVVVLHDVTREKEIGQMKTDFVSGVSHELRTPLASIKAYVEMLIDGEAEDEKTKREFYEIIAGEAERLSRLINNILDISRIESGVIRVVREPLSLTEVARQVLDVVVPQARSKSIALEDRLEPVFHHVEADRDKIYQAVLNLVGNAIKYTPDGGKVIVSTGVDEPRGVAVCEVADTGVGIGPQDLPHIFDKFYRIQGHTKMAKGTGLGLTLVKHLVETLHDGKLSVVSEEGKGSVFRLELPIID